MTQTYFKRYRMDISLRRMPRLRAVPSHYELIPWGDHWLDAHADTKYRSFRNEIDATLFPCLAEPSGCRRLMGEISRRHGFVPGATWLAVYRDADFVDFCGTVQGICDRAGFGGIQNLGVTPEHRGVGLGTCLLTHAMAGFRHAGMRTVHLEVTARNESAVRLYRQLGFRHTKTVYKSVEVAMA